MSPEKKKGNWADSLSAAMEKMAPIFDQPILASVRDGFVALMPLIIGRACSDPFSSRCASVMKQLATWRAHSRGYIRIPWNVFNVTFGLLSLYVVISVAYSLSPPRSGSPHAGVLLLHVLHPGRQPAGSRRRTWHFPGQSGLFTAIVVSVLSVEIFNFFVKKDIVIRCPKAFPGDLGCFCCTHPRCHPGVRLVADPFVLNFDLAGNLFIVLSKVVPAASTYVAAAIAETFHAFLWTMGIHGDLTIGIALEPVWQANLAANAQAVANGLAPTAVYTGLFRSFVVPGGSGATLPLAIYFTRSKSERLRRVGWLGIPPGIFNINEPITFGAPIIFNPILAIPFVIITFLNTTAAYLATSAGLVRPTYIAAPWTLPSPLLMFMSTGYDWRAIIVALITEFVIPGIIWYPAFKAWEKEVLKTEQTAGK